MKEPISISAHKRAFNDAKTEIVFDGPLEAPIKAGTEIGTLVISIPGQPELTTPVVTLSDVDKLSFMGRVFEGVSRMITPSDET